MEHARPLIPFALCATLAACGGGGGSGGPPIAPDGAQQSLDWAGYVKVGPAQSFNGASASWIVPTVSCGAGEDSDSSSWTGVGGGTTADPTLVQAGTDEDCVGGQPSYDAWWEAVPAPALNAGAVGPIDTGAFPVGPGDQMSVNVDGSNVVVWNITIHNDTRGWTFNVTVPYVSAGATAEWIQESPLSAGSSGVGQAPLTNFGRVPFFDARANGAPPALNLSERVVLVDTNGKVLANTSAPDRGDAFEVCYGGGGC